MKGVEEGKEGEGSKGREKEGREREGVGDLLCRPAAAPRGARRLEAVNEQLRAPDGVVVLLPCQPRLQLGKVRSGNARRRIFVIRNPAKVGPHALERVVKCNKQLVVLCHRGVGGVLPRLLDLHERLRRARGDHGDKIGCSLELRLFLYEPD